MMLCMRVRFARCFSRLFATFCAACSPVNVLNALIPRDGYTMHQAMAYGTLTRQTLDVYVPNGQADKPLPVVLFFYGGGWDSGRKEDYLFAAEAFTSKGYLTVIPDYRIFPEVKFPEFMQDAVSACKWVKTNIACFGGDTDAIFIVGHSAGAHIGMMLNLNVQYLALEQLKPNDFRGFIGLAGPYDFLPLQSDRLKDIFGPEDLRWQSQPINFVTGKNQPTLLLVGLHDETVWPRNSHNLAKAIREKNGPVKVIDYPRYHHVDMIAKIAKPFRKFNTLLDDMVSFIDALSTGF